MAPAQRFVTRILSNAPESRASLGGSPEAISVPGATATRAFGISSQGVVVGSYTDATNRVHGFVTLVLTL
jgi:hypothetical protein